MTATRRTVRLPVLLLLTVLVCSVPARAQPFDAAWQGSGPDGDIANAVATDADGNTYVAGTFSGTLTFGSITITSADDGSFSGPSDIFLVKYDADGNAVWARRGGSAEFNDFGNAVAVDGSGNVYVAGQIAGVDSTAFFDGGNNPIVDLGPANGFDMAVAKYDADGNLQWAHTNDSSQQNGSDNDAGNALATDASGNVYLGGGFSWTTTFGSFTLTSAGGRDAFLAKYDADGNVVWAKRGGSSGDFSSDTIADVEFGPEGDLYGMGDYENVATFGSESVQSNGDSDLFLVKYTPQGNVTQLSSVGGGDSEYAGGLGVDAAGNSYLLGSFSGSLLVDDDVLNATGFTDVFVAKFDSSGTAVWGRRGGGDGTNFGIGVSADDDGNVYATGYIEGNNITFNGESVSLVGGGQDAFLAAYRSDGALRKAVSMGGPDVDQGSDTAVSPDGATVYTTGSFRQTATFGSETLTSADNSDVFLAKSTAANLPVELASFQAAADGPDAVLSWQTASEIGNEGFGIEHQSAGQSAWQEVAFVDGAGTTTEAQTYRHRVTGLAPGQHRFRLRQVDTDGDDTYSAAVEVNIGPDGAYALSAAAPNPARTQARLRLTVQREQSVQVSLYNTLGQRVRVLHDGPVTPGEARAFTVEAGTLASGLYLVRVEGENFEATRTLTLVR